MTKIFLAAVFFAILSGGSAAQDAPLCQSVMDDYEAARAANDELPPLFERPFSFADLKPLTIGDVVIEDRMEQAKVAVKNHSGYLDCLPDGSFAIIDVCANLVPEADDEFLTDRFVVVAQTLLNIFEDEAGVARSSINPMLEEAGESLRAALVRGEPVPVGVSSDRELGPFLYTRIHTAPEFVGLAPAQMCFTAEWYEG